MGQVSSINHLAYMWRARIKEEQSIKEGGNGKGDWKFVRENIVVAWTISVTIFNQYILEYTFSDYAEEKFT